MDLYSTCDNLYEPLTIPCREELLHEKMGMTG